MTASNEPVLQTIGRASDNDVVVPHASVSAHHAELRQAGTAYRIVDLSSTNGTFVNGTRIQAQILDDEDTVHLGPVALEYSNGRLQIKVHEPLEPPPPPVQPVQAPPVPPVPEPPAEISKKSLTVLVGLAVAAAIAVAVVVATSGSEVEGPSSQEATLEAEGTDASPSSGPVDLYQRPSNMESLIDTVRDANFEIFCG